MINKERNFVYVVTTNGVDSSSVLGVYLTEEKAEEAIEWEKKFYDDDIDFVFDITRTELHG